MLLNSRTLPIYLHNVSYFLESPWKILNCRYDFVLNRWIKESCLRRKIPDNGSCGFVAMNGEIYVLTTSIQSFDPSDQWRTTKKRLTLEIQIYNPQRKKWRFLTTSPPFNHTICNHLIDYKTPVTCTVRV